MGSLGHDISTQRRWMIVAAILLTAALIEIPVILNPDLGCLLTTGEKVLDGRRLAVDVFELNPPLSVYMYMPATVLARMTGLAPELVVTILVMVEIIGALVLVDRAAAASGSGANERSLQACLLAFLLAILPSAVFGQREHIAVIALTPFVAVTAIRWRGLDPGRVTIPAGLGAGLALSIKPFLVLVVGLPIILVAIRQRSLRPLFTAESCTAAAVVIGYGAVIALVFPDYAFTYAPMVADAYLPVRVGLLGLLPFPIIVMTASFVFARRLAPEEFRFGGDTTPWLAAAVGGAASFILQGKAWSYTAFALCMFAVAAPLLHARVQTLRVPVVVGGFAAVLFIGFCMSIPSRGFPLLEDRVRALANHPRMLTITDHVGLGHPLIRQIGGTWVGSSCAAQLLAAGAMLQQNSTQPTEGTNPKLDSVIQFERRHLLADLRNGRPDVVLVDTMLLSAIPFDWLAWAKTDPELQAELSRYREVEDVGRVRIFVDRSKDSAEAALGSAAPRQSR